MLAHGLTIAFIFAIAANVIAAVCSLLTGRRKQPAEHESLGSELAAVSGEGVGELTELVTPDMVEDAVESRPRARSHGDRSSGDG
jgi:hypothetical protein